ncbi:threonine ammonia-lyase [Falsihalocynthiibacter arcticus]|uniref:Amino acid dehydratase n=1 Tax=Falsihalocynthiibacter arcticus TaxID=1579316 RepID=A0A126UZ94_9RHOB|nr:threonine/serine dehydratase [Falsihalocynthiibacter arcticus]AML51354.1 amino acid dehydratase [Falsihalocynthiibacter arcticus]
MSYPDLPDIKTAAESLRGQIIRTPSVRLSPDRIAGLPADAQVTMKMELFQETGTFKARGVLLAIAAMDPTARAAGVVAVSGGNHALAVAWGARKSGISAKVIMPKATDSARIEGCIALGAEVELAEDITAAFARMDMLSAAGATPLHPFESPYMTLGAATIGLEILTDTPDLDALVIPVGGGGLISGLALAAKLIHPNIRIYGVEPVGANSMTRSLEIGSPQRLDKVNTIADSLGSPLAMPYSFGLAQRYVDQMVEVEDDEMTRAMTVLFDGLKIVAEPACAATTAAITGPLKSELAGKNIGIIACGSNIGAKRFYEFLSSGAPKR